MLQNIINRRCARTLAVNVINSGNFYIVEKRNIKDLCLEFLFNCKLIKNFNGLR